MSRNLQEELKAAKAKVAEIEHLLKHRIPENMAGMEEGADSIRLCLRNLGWEVDYSFLHRRNDGTYEGRGFFLADLDRKENVHWEIKVDDTNCQVLVPISKETNTIP